MEDENTYPIPPDGGRPGDGPEGPDSQCRLGVSGGQFPCPGRCFQISACAAGAGYKAICPYCSIWTSLPEGAGLKVSHILDCTVCGYGKRISEAAGQIKRE